MFQSGPENYTGRCSVLKKEAQAFDKRQNATDDAMMQGKLLKSPASYETCPTKTTVHLHPLA
jgi:hypothetical protein